MKTTHLLVPQLFVKCSGNNYQAQDNTAFENGTIVVTAEYKFAELYKITAPAEYKVKNPMKISAKRPIVLKQYYQRAEASSRACNTLMVGVGHYFTKTRGVYCELGLYRSAQIDRALSVKF